MATPAHRRLDIQGLRAIAVLLVVLYHGGFHVPGGFVGVDVFFVISGFVITGVLLRDLSGSSTIRFGHFYARRAKRLLPALTTVIAFVVIVGLLAAPIGSGRMTAHTAAWAAVFAANAYIYNLGTGYFDVGAALNPLLHLWTLAVEEQFYVIFPALLFIAWKMMGSRSEQAKRVAGALLIGLLAVASFLLSLTLSNGHVLPHLGSKPAAFAYYGSPTRAWEFAAGAVLCLLAPSAVRIPHVVAHACGWLGIAAVVYAGLTLTGSVVFPGTAALLPVAGAAAIMLAGTATRTGVSSMLAVRPLTWLGDLSYSWYLWHWPLIVFAVALFPGVPAAPRVAAAISLLPAWACYRWIENPIRTSRRVRGAGVLALVAACIGLSFGVVGGALAVQNRLDLTTAVARFHGARASHADALRGCDSTTPLDQRRSSACTWTVPGARGSVVLVGDSQAGQFTEPLVAAARRAHLDLTVATLEGCPFLDIDLPSAYTGEASCRAFYTGTLRALVAHPPTLVVTASRSDLYVGNDKSLHAPGGPLVRTPSEKAKVWQRSLSKTLRALGRARVRTIVVHPIPKLPYDPEFCAVVRVLTSSCDPSLSRRSALRHLLRVDAVEDQAAASEPRATTLDVSRALCNPNCSMMRGALVLYVNASHVSVAGSRTLTRVFYAALSAGMRGAAGSTVRQ